MVKWGREVALVISVSKSKKTWHRTVTISISIGVITVPYLSAEWEIIS